MFPLLPFIAGVATGAFAVNALRRSEVQGGLRRARRAVREAADASMQRARRSSAQWRERWCRADDEADAPEAEDIEMVDASTGDEPGADAPRRRRTRRSVHRRTRQEEPDNGLEAEDGASAEDDAPAREAAGESDESSGA